MKKISLKNKRVLEKLNEFTEWFLDPEKNPDLIRMQDVEEMRDLGYVEPFDDANTIQHLKDEQERGEGHDGFPKVLKGFLIDDWYGKSSAFNKDAKQKVDKVCFDITKILCAHRNALCAYYPPGGFISWHTNWNASGYNVIMSYSSDGSGYFEYVDPATKEIVRVQDVPGEWTAKVGYFGKYEEEDKHFWHSAAAGDSGRITFSYVVPDKNMWEMMIDDLEDPDA